MFVLVFLIFFGLSVSLFFFTSEMAEGLGLEPISQMQGGILLGITCGVMLMGWVYNVLVECLAFHEKNTNS